MSFLTLKVAQLSVDNLFASRSKEEYEKLYIQFRHWRRENEINSFYENVLTVFVTKERSKTTTKPPYSWSIYFHSEAYPFT